MSHNLLLNKIHLIQYEYRKTLEYLAPKLKNDYNYTALDEIALFWNRYIEEVQLYLKYWFAGKDSYTFTSSAFLDFERSEHIPFLLMGKNHIVDDPLRKYVDILTKIPKGKNIDFLYRQIDMAVEAHLKILNNLDNQILILPVRLLNQKSSYQFLYEMGENAFISLFNDIDSLEQFYKKCETYEDIIRYAKDNIAELVLFSNDDDKKLPFEVRFKNMLEYYNDELSMEKTDANRFFMVVFGYIQQAIEVLVSCIEYECIPYVSYPISFHYIFLLSERMHKIEYIRTLRFKMVLLQMLYQLCDKDRIGQIEFKKFMKKIQTYNFDDKLFKLLESNGINENYFYDNNLRSLISDELERFYQSIEK